MSCIPHLYGGNKVVQVYSTIFGYHLSSIQPYFDCYQPKLLLYKYILIFKAKNMSCIPQICGDNEVVQVYSDLVAIHCYHLGKSQPYFDCYQPKPLLYKLILMFKT